MSVPEIVIAVMGAVMIVVIVWKVVRSGAPSAGKVDNSTSWWWTGGD